jgi:hypothetical protein
MVLAGILAALIEPRGEPAVLAVGHIVDMAMTAFTALLLMYSAVLLNRSVRTFRKDGNKSPVISSLGLTALILGMLLSHLKLENTAVTVCVFALIAMSITISIRGMNANKQDIARMAAEAAERERRGM